MLQLPQRLAETVPCPNVAKPAGVDAPDAIFGTTPAGFDLNNQPIPMLVYWLKKARTKVDGITADALTAGEYSEADLAAAMTPFNQIFDAIVNAESDSASDVAWQVQAVVDYLDCLETDSIEEAINATQFRKIAANLKRATAFRQPKKRLGKASKGRRLTRTGLLQRYQSFLIDELSTAPRHARSAPIRRAFTKLEALDEQKNQVGPSSKGYSALMSRCVALADKIIGMPAKNLDDVLLKIAAVGVCADRNNDAAPLKEWSFTPSGFVCDDEPPKLLLSLRDDLQRLHGAI